MKDSAQQRMTPDSLRPRTPIARSEHKGHESITVNSSQSLPEVFDTSDRKSTVEIELVSLTDNQNEFDEAELNFLYWLDTEITKIDEFYQEKEKVAIERYKIISAQLEALRELRDSHLTDEWNRSFQGISTRESSDHGDRSGFRSTWQPLISKFHTMFDRFYSTMPAADHERRVKDPELMAKPITTKAGYVDYRLARRRLKEAILEFYRGMELLQGYRLLNRVGLTKILKKFDKTTGRKISGEYAEKLKSRHFNQSGELESLMDNAEVRDHLRIS